MQRICVWSAILAGLVLIIVGSWALQAVAAEPRGATAELGRRFGETRVDLAVDALRRDFPS